MKWYDYIAVALYADVISATLIHNPIMLWLPIFSYLLYEHMRKEFITKQSD